jgi:hypothetical protein
MWNMTTDLLEDGRVRTIAIERAGTPLTYADVIELWQHDHQFREFFAAQLANAPFAAYFWECPPVTADSVERRFEFALVDSPQLARVTAEERAFAAQFAAADVGDGISTFWNLGRDALLVVPCPRGPLAAYPHIAAFARAAPEDQQHALWAAVGTALRRRLSHQPVWLSTSGLGVSWLHIRLDSRPKYYSFRPYRSAR